jgi:predicted ester cyclase
MSHTTRSRPLVLLLAAIAAASSCSTERADSGTEDHAAVLRGYVDALNRGDESYLDEYFGPGYVYHGPDGDLDVDAFKALHHSLLTAFPDGTMSPDDILTAGDKVTTRWTFHGVHSGDFQGIAPTGREVTLTGVIISRFQGGRVVEEWEQIDRLGMMQQLGVLPPPGAGAEGGEGDPGQ